MTATSATNTHVRPLTSGRSLPWYSYGIANLVVVTALALAFWYLLVDPSWSGLHLYPQPFLALLFWAILAVVWVNGVKLSWHR